MSRCSETEETVTIDEVNVVFRYPEEDACSSFMLDMAARKNGFHSGAPWWHSWALKMAFRKGAEWQRQQIDESITSNTEGQP